LERIHEMRLDPDAQIRADLLEAIDERGNVVNQAELVFTSQDEIARVRRGRRMEKIRIDQENARAIFQGMRRDEKTGEIILRFRMQEDLQMGSRFRVGTHKAVVSIVEGLEKLFPGIDVLYFPSIEKRGQYGEIAAGQLAK